MSSDFDVRLEDVSEFVYNKSKKTINTRGSAIAEEPRDALRQLKYYGRFFDWAIDKKLMEIQRNDASTLPGEIV